MTPRVWLITGSNSGLGLAMAKYALSQGDHVIAGVRSVSKLPESLKTAGAHAHVIDYNAAASDIHAAGLAAVQIHGRIDVLVNNAATSIGGPVEELTDEDFKTIFQTNFFGPVSLTRSLLPAMRAARTGCVVNVSSVIGLVPWAGGGIYSTTKAALESVSEVLSQELKPFGIRVLIVEPGYFPTNFLAACRLAPPTSVYTLPSQGYGVSGGIAPAHFSAGQVGDMAKAAARVYEAVHGTGMLAGKEYLRLPLGPDSGEAVPGKLREIINNFEALEEVWRSTDMDEEQVAEARAARGM